MDGYGNCTQSTETLVKLAVSKSRNQRGAVVHNYAHSHELCHTLRTIDSIRDKTCKSIDFEQRKFLQSLSLSNEDLRKVAQGRAARNNNKVLINVEKSDGRADIRHFGGSDEGLALSRTPPSVRKDLLRVQLDDFPRSVSDLDLSRLRRSSCTRSRTYSEGLVPVRAPRVPKSMDSPAPEKILDPYSISSSMKISDSRGTFEACTGKSGLNAWMGKKCASPKSQRKLLY